MNLIGIENSIKTLEENVASLKGKVDLLETQYNSSTDKLDELKKVTKSGFEESIYMERRLKLKEIMVSVTGSTKSLGKDIEKLLKKYDSYTEDFVINPEELELKPLDEIWKQIDS